MSQLVATTTSRPSSGFDDTCNSQPRIAVFGTPAAANFGIELALHRRRNKWYIVYPRAYGMAQSRWWATLNYPRRTDLPSTGPPASLQHLHHRFWFNSAEAMLDDLLKAKPPVLKVTGTSRTEQSSNSSWGLDVEAKQVEVLINEDQLCRRCMFCGLWEVSGSNRRYEQVGQDGEDRLYWCGHCSRVLSVWEKMSNVTLWPENINQFDLAYFQYRG